jgi:hypothetical protein
MLVEEVSEALVSSRTLTDNERQESHASMMCKLGYRCPFPGDAPYAGKNGARSSGESSSAITSKRPGLLAR